MEGFMEDFLVLERCPICQADLRTFSKVDLPNYPVGCTTCGSYRMHFELAHLLYEDSRSLGMPAHLVSGFTRENSIRGRPVTLDWDLVQGLHDSGLIPRSPAEQVDRLLLNLAHMTKHPGHPVHLNKESDHSLAYAAAWLEADFYILQLVDEGYLKQRDVISLKGWDRVQDLKKTAIESKSAFIAMSFDPTMDKASASIHEAISRSGYNPIRVDSSAERKLGRIDDLIVAEIKTSRFIVADFTGQKGGVYFEAGLALGLHIPVIWSCRRDEVEGNLLHFDTRQFGHIVWDTEEELGVRLYNKIRATIA